ncbi:hypothetical protein FA13DRAFT_1649668, partial [Coprinellus micaceus]
MPLDCDQSTIQHLPDDYSHFVTSLLLLDKLDKATITQAFLTEETQRGAPVAQWFDALSAAALSASSASSSSTSSCTFCTRPGHTQATCRTFANAQKRARDYVASGGSKKRQEKSKKAEETAAASVVTEFAGNASAVPDLTDPSSPIQPHTDFCWNADSGCTSTMTPHRHWIRNYRPLRVGVELADGSIIYSAGVGTVVVDPVVDGKTIRSVELTRVLHVP